MGESPGDGNRNAKDAAEFFVQNIVLRHGTPENVVTDCEKCFVSAFMQEGMKAMGAHHRTCLTNELFDIRFFYNL